jgi:hypothetical protein
MWDLWWTKWHWDSFLSEFFDFPPSISFHCGTILIHCVGDKQQARWWLEFRDSLYHQQENEVNKVVLRAKFHTAINL